MLLWGLLCALAAAGLVASPVASAGMCGGGLLRSFLITSAAITGGLSGLCRLSRFLGETFAHTGWFASLSAAEVALSAVSVWPETALLPRRKSSSRPRRAVVAVLAAAP